MDEENRAELAHIFSAFDDFNLTVIKTFLEVAKLLPPDSRKPVADALRELVEEHKAANGLFLAFFEKSVNGERNAE